MLREGSNGWNCFPDFPATPGNDPMCLDAPWITFVNAMLAKKPPEITQMGFGYMIAPGGGFGSNTDPFATKETADNEWGQDPPHIMIVVPKAEMLPACRPIETRRPLGHVAGDTVGPHHGAGRAGPEAVPAPVAQRRTASGARRSSAAQSL